MPLTTLKTSGLANLEKALAELGKQSGMKALTGALRDAAKPIIKEARSIAPKGNTGDLKKGIKSEVFRGKGKTDSVATIQIGFNKKTAWYGQILERGAKKHKIRRKGKSGGPLKINDGFAYEVSHPGTKSIPMLSRSFDSKYKEALQILTKRLRERIILEAIKKYGKSA